jgi:hypothetical protein
MDKKKEKQIDTKQDKDGVNIDREKAATATGVVD